MACANTTSRLTKVNGVVVTRMSVGPGKFFQLRLRVPIKQLFLAFV
jgi:hypothetical protein